MAMNSAHLSPPNQGTLAIGICNAQLEVSITRWPCRKWLGSLWHRSRAPKEGIPETSQWKSVATLISISFLLVVQVVTQLRLLRKPQEFEMMESELGNGFVRVACWLWDCNYLRWVLRTVNEKGTKGHLVSDFVSVCRCMTLRRGMLLLWHSVPAFSRLYYFALFWLKSTGLFSVAYKLHTFKLQQFEDCSSGCCTVKLVWSQLQSVSKPTSDRNRS